MKILDLKDIENILYEVFSVNKFPKKIQELKYGDFNEWDSLGNFNLLLAVEEFYNIRFTSEEITNIRSVEQLIQILKIKLK
jgi:acyl carrier protein